MVTPTQESYACTTLEQSAQVTVFQVMGAQNKLRELLNRRDVVRVSPRQRFKVVGINDKLAQITESDSDSTTELWIPARNLVAVGDPERLVIVESVMAHRKMAVGLVSI